MSLKGCRVAASVSVSAQHAAPGSCREVCASAPALVPSLRRTVLGEVCALVLCSHWPVPACLSSMPSSSPPGVVSVPLPRPHTNSPSLLGDVGTSPLNSRDTRHSVPSTVSRPLFEHGPLWRAGTRFPHLRVSSTCSVGSSQVRSECPWTDHGGRRVPRCSAYWQCPVQSGRRRGSLPQPVSGSILYQDTPKWKAMHVLWAGLLSGPLRFPQDATSCSAQSFCSHAEVLLPSSLQEVHRKEGPSMGVALNSVTASHVEAAFR